MDAPDRPLAASQKTLLAIAGWGRARRRQMMAILEDHKQPYHRQAGAAYAFRLPNLCSAIVLLNDAALFDEAATLMRVVLELAITLEWVGNDDNRAWHLVRDAEDARKRGDSLRQKFLSIESTVEALTDAKPLPNLRARAEQAGPEAMAFYAGGYQWGSEPTHGALSAIRFVGAEDNSLYGRGVAGLAVQSALRLALLTVKTLKIADGTEDLRAADAEWKIAR